MVCLNVAFVASPFTAFAAVSSLASCLGGVFLPLTPPLATAVAFAAVVLGALGACAFAGCVSSAGSSAAALGAALVDALGFLVGEAFSCQIATTRRERTEALPFPLLPFLTAYAESCSAVKDFAIASCRFPLTIISLIFPTIASALASWRPTLPCTPCSTASSASKSLSPCELHHATVVTFLR